MIPHPPHSPSLPIPLPRIPVCGRRQSCLFFEYGIKVVRVGESGCLGDGGDGHIAVHQKLLSLNDADLTYVVVDIKAGDGLKNSGKVIGGIA